MIETTSLTKVYRSRRGTKTACQSVTLRVEPGTVLGLIGPNGAGKTTLVRMLATTVVPTTGTASVCQFDVKTQASQVRNCIGVLSGDNRSFYWRLSGLDNLEFFGTMHGLSLSQARTRGRTWMEQLGLPTSPQATMKYSTGMLKRLGLARAMLHDPNVLLLDEPFDGVDPLGADLMREAITKQAAAGKTAVITTHNLEEVERSCTLVALMANGRILRAGSPDELKNSMRRRLVSARVVASDAQDLTRRLALVCGSGFVTVSGSSVEAAVPAEESALRDVLTLLSRFSGTIADVTITSPSLRYVMTQTLKEDGHAEDSRLHSERLANDN